ncbi:MAG: DNA mismatch repair protein MutS, partial [Lachnospiraceae bacterium]|nr:DNA mismatch repair protein MutS [Lachnospiraceae bacterium]
MMSEEYTPMMRQYLETKEEYKDCILFYRLGDFYEMFFDDAIKVSRELELTLTKKSCGTTEKAPMCGVPFHAADSYIARLIHKGYKVAICEQVEDPKEAKGLVKREVIRIVTPGTAIDQAILSEDDNNYILCVHYLPGQYGMAFCDVSTGEFVIILADTEQKARDELARYNPSEVIANDGFMISPVYTSELYKRYGVPVSLLEAAYFNGDEARKRLREQFGQEEIDPLYERDMEPALDAASALLRYLKETQMRELFHIRHITLCDTGSYMLIDTATHRNLELVETMRDKEKKGSLLWVLDHTRTAMGARLLKSYVEQPLT